MQGLSDIFYSSTPQLSEGCASTTLIALERIVSSVVTDAAVKSQGSGPFANIDLNPSQIYAKWISLLWKV